MSMSIEDDFYFHFDKNIGSNAPKRTYSTDDPVNIYIYIYIEEMFENHESIVEGLKLL